MVRIQPSRRVTCAAAASIAAAVAFLAAAPQPSGVRVWTSSIRLPTYVEGPANPNPPFDLFTVGKFNYPYPIRDALTETRETISWRTLQLENEYLRLTVLPDLGGHIYSCLDKRSGREMFYANPAIKKALIGYRGAWAALGVEFNFPVSHNWMSISPVDFATLSHADGSGSIWVGNTDRVYGARWRVELTLHPGRAELEQRVDLYNASDVRHRYYWWSNGAVQVWDDSRLVYPTEVMGTHGFTSVEPWPIDRRGRDLSVIRNQTDGPVSLFTYKTHEPFVGIYHARTNSGTVHVASPSELPVHKVWSWGHDRDAATWRTALSDDDSAYIELQAGLFRNQETYAFLEPQESIRFTEHWLPVRDLGGITRANVDAVLNMERTASGRLELALDVTRDFPDARVVVTQAGASLADTRVTLSPREIWRTAFDVPAAAPASIRVTDREGRVVIAHEENRFDRTPAADVRLGRPEVPSPAPRSPSGLELVEKGQVDELEGRRLAAMATYESGLQQYPSSVALLKAAGRLAVVLGWPEAQEREKAEGKRQKGEGAERAIEWLEAAYARNTTDLEVQYYLGLALAAVGRHAEARTHLESVQRFSAWRAAASLQLGRLAAKDGDLAVALRQIQTAAAESPRATTIGAIEASLLRRLGRTSEARDRARYSLTIDPTSSVLRYELVLLGGSDDSLMPHLGADVTRALDLADHYLAIGAYRDALDLLDRRYPSVDPPAREPGAVPPQESPLAVYYRGYLRQLTGGSATADFATARTLSTAYAFPNRRSSYAVLRSALQAQADDPAARFLLGSLYLASGLVDPAVAEWQTVRRAGAHVPTLHRNLALALLHPPSRLQALGATPADVAEARAVLEEGTSADGGNVEVYLTLDGVLSAARAAPAARAAALRKFPSAEAMPASLVFKLALALAESGDAAGAERLFHDRFFPREEGGTNVRAVYAQARLTSARIRANAADCRTALGVLDSLPREQKDLAFTAGGLADALTSPAMVRQIAAIESTCGRQQEARGRWQQLERALTLQPGSGQAAPLTLAIADEARQRLGKPRTPAERRLLEEALETATRTLDTGNTSNPGLVELSRASLLASLGSVEESRRAQVNVFVYPDRNLSHALARTDIIATARTDSKTRRPRSTRRPRRSARRKPK